MFHVPGAASHALLSLTVDLQLCNRVVCAFCESSNEGEVLSVANVGASKGIRGTDVAK